MTKSRRCPAVWAGLAGALALSAPEAASAATLVAPVSSPVADSLVPFAFGCVTGAAMGAAAGLIVSHARSGRAAARPSHAATGHVEVREVSNEPEVTRHARQSVPAAARHARPAGAATGARRTEGAASDAAHAASHAPAAHAPSRRARRGAAATQATPGADAAPRPARHAASDYGDIAENYVRRASLVERMATRARGVASVLGDRLGQNMMDGVPVIERADGSVGDVGTSWWNAAVGDAIPTESPLAREEPTAPARPTRDPEAPRGTAPQATAPAGFSAAPRAAAAQPGATVAASQFSAPAQATSGASPARPRVADRLAEIDLGLYPEKRRAEELDAEEDLWQVALEALDEQVAQQAPLGFEDAVGGTDTLDEPDGLEAPTRFIPFRTPAGHPEVVDTESYVDYLIGDEFSRNESSSARRNARAYLHVIEGGGLTAGIPGRSRRASRAPHRPRHMAAAPRAHAEERPQVQEA